MRPSAAWQHSNIGHWFDLCAVLLTGDRLSRVLHCCTLTLAAVNTPLKTHSRVITSVGWRHEQPRSQRLASPSGRRSSSSLLLAGRSFTKMYAPHDNDWTSRLLLCHRPRPASRSLIHALLLRRRSCPVFISCSFHITATPPRARVYVKGNYFYKSLIKGQQLQADDVAAVRLATTWAVRCCWYVVHPSTAIDLRVAVYTSARQI